MSCSHCQNSLFFAYWHNSWKWLNLISFHPCPLEVLAPNSGALTQKCILWALILKVIFCSEIRTKNKMSYSKMYSIFKIQPWWKRIKKETLETKYTSLQHLTKSRIFKQIYPLAALDLGRHFYMEQYVARNWRSTNERRVYWIYVGSKVMCTLCTRLL